MRRSQPNYCKVLLFDATVVVVNSGVVVVDIVVVVTDHILFNCGQ